MSPQRKARCHLLRRCTLSRKQVRARIKRAIAFPRFTMTAIHA